MALHIVSFRSVVATLALLSFGGRAGANALEPLRLSADDVREQLRTPQEHDADLRPDDPFGRSRGQLDLGAINPSLRLEYGSGSNTLVDPNAAFDNLSDAQRAERGLAAPAGSQLYDAALRFDAATLGDVAVVVRSGLRGALNDPAPNAGVLDSIQWSPVAGAGLEWRPTREFFLAGSTLLNLDEGRGVLAEITAELGMRVTPDLSVSLGYRTLDSNFRAPSDAAEDLRDAAFAAIRLRF